MSPTSSASPPTAAARTSTSPKVKPEPPALPPLTTTASNPTTTANSPSTTTTTKADPSSAATEASDGLGPMRRKPSRRANTAERRATHNAVERQRRETLNGRFLDLAHMLPNLASVRRPSKSAIVNSSIALIHATRRQRGVAARELRLLHSEALSLRREVNEWRERSGLRPTDEPPRSADFHVLLSVEEVEEGDEEREAYAAAAAADMDEEDMLDEQEEQAGGRNRSNSAATGGNGNGMVQMHAVGNHAGFTGMMPMSMGFPMGMPMNVQHQHQHQQSAARYAPGPQYGHQQMGFDALSGFPLDTTGASNIKLEDTTAGWAHQQQAQAQAQAQAQFQQQQQLLNMQAQQQQQAAQQQQWAAQLQAQHAQQQQAMIQAQQFTPPGSSSGTHTSNSSHTPPHSGAPDQDQLMAQAREVFLVNYARNAGMPVPSSSSGIASLPLPGNYITPPPSGGMDSDGSSAHSVHSAHSSPHAGSPFERNSPPHHSVSGTTNGSVQVPAPMSMPWNTGNVSAGLGVGVGVGVGGNYAGPGLSLYV